MIHWLTQSYTELPESIEAVKNGGYLSEAEYRRLSLLRTNKRRKDWLLGRWTAKRLLQTVIWEKDGITLPLDMIMITNKADGVSDYQLPIANHQYSISISHSSNNALVAIIEKPDIPVGADMKLITPRPSGFAESFFTKAELALGEGLVGKSRTVWETAVWSAKEAVLKALHLAWSVDTQAISCLIEPVNHLPQTWLPFAIKCDNGRLPAADPTLTGWWRVEDDFVLTIAAGT